MNRKAYSLALQRLLRHGQSRFELAAYLQRKGIVAAEIETVIARLVELGYLDDDKLKEAIVSKEREQHGEMRIRQKLRKRGLNDEVTLDVEDEERVAQEVITRKIRLWATDSPLNTKRKAYALLRRRGFSHEIAIATLRSMSLGDVED